MNFEFHTMSQNRQILSSQIFIEKEITENQNGMRTKVKTKNMLCHPSKEIWNKNLTLFRLHLKFITIWYYYYHNFHPWWPMCSAALTNLRQITIYHVQTIFQQPINKTNVPISIFDFETMQSNILMVEIFTHKKKILFFISNVEYIR